MGTLVARKYRTALFLKLADHTYVECGTGAKGWSCWGGKTGGTEFHSGSGSTLRANAIAQPNERGGITCYLVNGVCHQAANRILYPAGILVTGARGYGVSEALYGPYGRPRGFLGFCRAPFDRHENVSGDLPECIDQGAGASEELPESNPQEKQYASRVAEIYEQQSAGPLMDAAIIDEQQLLSEITEFQIKLFSLMMDYRLGPNVAAGNTYGEMLEHRTQTEKTRFALEQEFGDGGMDVNEFATEINNEFVDFQRKSANTLNEKDYLKLFGVSRDEEVWLGDPEIARQAYSNPQQEQEE